MEPHAQKLAHELSAEQTFYFVEIFFKPARKRRRNMSLADS
jgi:hypothetical protein